MKLENLSLGHRIAVTFGIVLAILLALALFGFLTGAWDRADAQQRTPELYQGVPLDSHLLTLDKDALEQAYKQHLIKLWNVWLTDGAKEAHRITNGLQIARQSYRIAAAQIEKREQQLQGVKP